MSPFLWFVSCDYKVCLFSAYLQPQFVATIKYSMPVFGIPYTVIATNQAIKYAGFLHFWQPRFAAFGHFKIQYAVVSWPDLKYYCNESSHYLINDQGLPKDISMYRIYAKDKWFSSTGFISMFYKPVNVFEFCF